MHWMAVYKDGSSLSQFEKDCENSYFSIDRSRLSSFLLIDKHYHPVVRVVIERPTQRLIYRRRVFRSLLGIGNVQWLVGWIEELEGRLNKFICTVEEDGFVLLTDDVELSLYPQELVVSYG